MSLRTFAVVVALLGAGCSVSNPSHCGNLAGDVTCQSRGAALPYCSLCVGENDGCVAEPASDLSCRGATSAGLATSTTAPTTGSTGGSGTTEVGSGGGTGTGTTSPTTTATSGTTEGSGTTGGSSTGGTGSSGTTEIGSTSDMSSGTDSSGGSTGGGPMCGNGVIEGMEACDKNSFGGKTCLDFGMDYGGGMLKCTQNCTVDTSGCCKIAGKSCLSMAECCSNKCVLTCQ